MPPPSRGDNAKRFKPRLLTLKEYQLNNRNGILRLLEEPTPPVFAPCPTRQLAPSLMTPASPVLSPWEAACASMALWDAQEAVKTANRKAWMDFAEGL